MTRQEAIKILEHLKPSNQVYNANDAYAVGQALCMAINSLETDEAYQLEYEKPESVYTKDKLDAALDKVERVANSGQWNDSVKFGMQHAIWVIKQQLMEGADEADN